MAGMTTIIIPAAATGYTTGAAAGTVGMTIIAAIGSIGARKPAIIGGDRAHGHGVREWAMAIIGKDRAGHVTPM
jgi:hypothetical protein